MSRKFLGGVIAVAGLLLTGASARADAITTLNTLYSGGTWVKVTDDKLWYREPEFSGGSVFATVKSASGSFLLGTQASGGSPNSVFGGVSGTAANQQLRLDTGTNPGQGGTFLTDPSGKIPLNVAAQPWAWDLYKLDGSYTLTAGQTLNQASSHIVSSFNSMDVGGERMVAYRNTAWGPDDYNRYILMWETDATIGDDYSDLVLDVKGVRNPEPASMTLMGLGLAGLVGYGARYVRRRKATATAEAPAVA